VNGQKLTAPQPLKDGDQIAIGDTVLIFLQGETVAAIDDQPPSGARQPAAPPPGRVRQSISLSPRWHLRSPPKPRRP